MYSFILNSFIFAGWPEFWDDIYTLAFNCTKDKFKGCKRYCSKCY